MKNAQSHVNTIMLKEMARKLVYFQGVLDTSPDIILVLDLKKKIINFSKSGENTLGYKSSDLVNRSFTSILKREEQTRELIQLIDKDGDVDEFQIQAKTPQKTVIPFSIGVRQLFDDENTLIGYVINMHDIHRRIKLEKRLRRQHAELDSIVTHCGAMIVTTNAQGRITKINPKAEKILGVRNQEMIGRTMLDYYVDKNLRRQVVQFLKKQESIEYEAEIYAAGGEIRTFFVVLSNIRSPLTNKLLGTVGISHDITLRKEAENSLHKLLITDSLTELGNRRHFFNELNLALKKAAQSPRHAFSLAFVDFDSFKAYNDTFGHQKGDELLRQFGELCRELCNMKSPPLFFRYGGDEFVTLIPHSNLEKTKRFLEKFRRKFFKITNKHVTLSIGVTSYKRKDNVEKIINRADAAVYTSKKTGRNKTTIDPSN